MAATINETAPSSSISSIGPGIKPELVGKVDSQVPRINDLYLFSKEDGLITAAEDRSVRVLLRRDSGQYWPSIVESVSSVPTAIAYDENSYCLLVGMINGAIIEYAVSPDLNSLQHRRQLTAHTQAVAGIVLSTAARTIFSCGKDKTVVWYCADSGVKVGSYVVEAICTSMTFDSESKFCFVGDYNGSIYVLKVVGNSAQLISKLSAHTASITALTWDSLRGQLYSGSADTLVIKWDIAGQKGTCYELNGHDSKISSIVLAEKAGRLFSVDTSGHMVCWDLKARRLPAPGWHDNDHCEICDVPFFWNVKVMWDRKIVGVRRHHCRTCGSSVCNTCCNNFTVFPAMGFEKKARICKTCHTKMQNYPHEFDLTPLAVQCELSKSIATMHLQEETGRLAAVGYDRSVMIWNVSMFL